MLLNIVIYGSFGLSRLLRLSSCRVLRSRSSRVYSHYYLENEDVKISLNVLFLFISGLLLLIIGGGILLMPQAFYASDGVFLGNNPSLLSEVRASGGMLTGGALVIFAGIIRPALRSLAMMLSILIYGSFGLARLLSLTIDGMPSHNLIVATAVELTVSAIGITMLYLQPDTRSTVN